VTKETSTLETDPRKLLSRYGLHAKKSWGQNFLIAEHAYQSIVSACALMPGDVAVEIGAGLGTLSSRLLLAGARVIAIEPERDMCEVLRAELGAREDFELRQEDALKLDLAALGLAQKPVVVGNLPYQIATPLLFRFLAQHASLRHIVVMLQREVAERILAPPGGAAYGALSAQIQLLATVERVCHVGRGGFVPAPRVESTVLRLLPLSGTRVPVKDVGLYSQVVRGAFAQRRKTLRNAFRAAFGDEALLALAATGIDLSRRGETLGLAEFARLADALADYKSQGSLPYRL
jgi:16S rRNA (adenine1518-N6/adenine1519-N6)-dimethyltransferase